MEQTLNLTLLGYSETTRAIAKRFGPATFYDDSVNKPFTDQEQNALKPSAQFNPKYSSLEVPSPDLQPHHSLIQKAQHLISEYDLFLSSTSPLAQKTLPLNIWVSGTKGKSTTTQILQHLLSEKGSQSGGNKGTPLANLDQDAPIWILETSSFMLHYTHQASPNLYILLPIMPEHLTWHGNYEAYCDAKLKPLKTMKEGEVAIVPKAFAHVQTKAYLITYENEEDLAQTFGIDTKKIKLEGTLLLNALLAMAIEKILYDQTNYHKINTFDPESRY